MNVTTTHSLISSAAIYAGEEFLLAIPHRAGRFPIRVTNTAFPEIRWISSDAIEEAVVFSGEEARSDHSRAVKELQAGELLVSSVDDMTDPDGSPAEHHLVGIEPEEGIHAGQDGAA